MGSCCSRKRDTLGPPPPASSVWLRAGSWAPSSSAVLCPADRGRVPGCYPCFCSRLPSPWPRSLGAPPAVRLDSPRGFLCFQTRPLPPGRGRLRVGEPVCSGRTGASGSAVLPLGFIQCLLCPTVPARVPLLLTSAVQRGGHPGEGSPAGWEESRGGKGERVPTGTSKGGNLVWSGNVPVWPGQRLGAGKSHPS